MKLSALDDPSIMTNLTESVTNNKLDHLTCAYYLLLQKKVHKIERFRKSVAMPKSALKTSKSLSGSSRRQSNNDLVVQNKLALEDDLGMFAKRESMRISDDKLEEP